MTDDSAHSSTGSQEVATLGGGCFWCLEAVFEQLQGVSKVVSGYAGGQTADPTYHQVCGGGTGHAEVVQVTFDPGIISFREILEVFFAMHNPTTLNRQGADVGTQYRSIILTHAPQQKETAERLIGELTGVGTWSQPVVTQIVPLDRFYPAEDYHQGYYRDNTAKPYCQVVISPKLAHLRERFAQRLRQGAS